MINIALNDNEKTLVLTCFPDEAAKSLYDRVEILGIDDAKNIVKEYIDSLNLPSPTHVYLKAAPIVGLKLWNKL
jgi:hypothetical protein